MRRALIAGSALLVLAAPARADDAALLVEGARAYAAACASCHGDRGDGRGPAARGLDPPPRDFTRGEYKFRSTPSGTIPTDDDLRRAIRRGAPGTAMPAWERRIPPAQIDALVARVKSFSRRFREEHVDPAQAIRPPPPPPATPASIARGRALYRVLQCWTCHGKVGRGDGASAPTLRDSAGRPAPPFDFTSGPYRGGRAPDDVYRTFSTGVDGTPMPAFADVLLLGREAFADLTAVAAAGFSPPEIAEVRAAGAALPTFEAIGSLDDAARRALLDANRYALVHYVLSLRRPRRLLDYLFFDPAGRLDDPLFASSPPARR